MNMKFGKVKYAETEEWNTNLEPFTIVPLSDKSSEISEIYLGGTEWGNSGWKGSLYPTYAKPKDYLKYYQEQLNTIELNSTFYRIPDMLTVEKWNGMVNTNFRFCPKVSLLVSRTQDLDRMKYFIDEFSSSVRKFGENLGPCFIQWPENLGIGNIQIFEYFAANWPDDLEISMEFRHSDCFENRLLHIDLLGLLSEYSMDSVVTDVMGRRDVVHSTIIHKNLLIRFVASGNLQVDYKRLNEWKKSIDELQKIRSCKVYLFIHEGENSKVPELTLYADSIFFRPKRIKLWKDNNSYDKNQTSLF